jgi:hypothetical protein
MFDVYGLVFIVYGWFEVLAFGVCCVVFIVGLKLGV